MEITIGLLVISHVLVAWGAVRLFQYGLLYGRHWNFQEKTQDIPTNPSTAPTKARAPFIGPETLVRWPSEPFPEPAPTDYRSEQVNPFAEPAIGGKDAIPPASNS